MSTRKPASPKARTQIFLVDDHPLMRDGLRLLIQQQPDMAVCGEAEDGLAALTAIEKLKPDLVLADITLPGKSGLELIKDIQALRPGLPVLVLSMHDENLYAERVLRAGGRGYVMKQEGGGRMIEAIRQVLAGKIAVSERMASRILEVFSGRRPTSGDSPVARLSDREFEVFQLIGEGRGTTEIATQLHLSVKTVEAHRANIKQKLALKSAPELVRAAVRWVEKEQG
jgi:DNA-binding NarL/FixJ family response regulator